MLIVAARFGWDRFNDRDLGIDTSLWASRSLLRYDLQPPSLFCPRGEQLSPLDVGSVRACVQSLEAVKDGDGRVEFGTRGKVKAIVKQIGVLGTLQQQREGPG